MKISFLFSSPDLLSLLKTVMPIKDDFSVDEPCNGWIDGKLAWKQCTWRLVDVDFPIITAHCLARPDYRGQNITPKHCEGCKDCYPPVPRND